MEELQSLIYTGALTTVKIHTIQKDQQLSNTQKKLTKPAWQHRIQEKIKKLRRYRTTNTIYT